MATLIIKNPEESVLEILKRRAERHGRTLEEEVREILTTAVRNEPSAKGRGSKRTGPRPTTND